MSNSAPMIINIIDHIFLKVMAKSNYTCIYCQKTCMHHKLASTKILKIHKFRSSPSKSCYVICLKLWKGLLFPSLNKNALSTIFYISQNLFLGVIYEYHVLNLDKCFRSSFSTCFFTMARWCQEFSESGILE